MDRLSEIRRAEEASHIEIYTQKELYAPGSWLARPVKTVMDLLPLFGGYTQFRALDLGCGVGRNSIAVARAFRKISCRVDCVDILELAIEKLKENAVHYGVAGQITGIVSSIDRYPIEPEHYDLILAVSALEHVENTSVFRRKLQEIREGLREGGSACLILNSGVQEWDQVSGTELQPQFEVNLRTEDLVDLLRQTFAGWDIQCSVVPQRYTIPRAEGPALLETRVVTFIVRRR